MEQPKPKNNYVRGITIFLALLLFLPPIKQALDIRLFKIEDGYVGLYNLFVAIAMIFLFPALMFNSDSKIDIPFFKRFFKDDND